MSGLIWSTSFRKHSPLFQFLSFNSLFFFSFLLIPQFLAMWISLFILKLSGDCLNEMRMRPEDDTRNQLGRVIRVLQGLYCLTDNLWEHCAIR